MEPPAATVVWHPVRRVLFRVTFVYLALYNTMFPLNILPFTEFITEPYTNFWHKIVVWVGQQIFHRDITVFTNGSGDTTYDYVLVFCYFVLALVAASLWSGLDRQRTNYGWLYEWLCVGVRYVLALTMISYGLAKVFQSQFPLPPLDRLLQPYGDSSPMGLLWTFMGASPLFNLFTGLGECVGGLFLAFRRTTLLGALVSLAVLSNVVMLNFSYDVPVKLYSAHLLALTGFLLLPELKRLLNVLWLNRAAEPVVRRPHFTRPQLNGWMSVLGAVLVVAFTAWQVYDEQQGRKEFGDLAPKSPLYGIWNVAELEVDGVIQPPLLSNEQRWRRVVFDWPQMMAIQLISDARTRYNLTLDAEKKTLALTKRDDPKWKSLLTYERPEPNTLTLAGTFDGKPIRAKLQRKDVSEYLLLSRGFHWISEYPFNR